MRAISISVYRSPIYSGCSNGGISERYDSLLLIHPEGWIEIDECDPPENLVRVVERRIGSRIYRHLEPVASPVGIGWMSGGSYAGSSDARFCEISDYPLSIHDRRESPEMYEMLSR